MNGKPIKLRSNFVDPTFVYASIRLSLKTKCKKKKRHTKKGKALFSQVIRLTGIPSQTLKSELKAVLDKKQIDIHGLTLDQLRTAAASYLREIMGSLLDKYGHRRTDSLN